MRVPVRSSHPSRCLLKEEADAGLTSAETFADFGSRVASLQTVAPRLLHQLKARRAQPRGVRCIGERQHPAQLPWRRPGDAGLRRRSQPRSSRDGSRRVPISLFALRTCCSSESRPTSSCSRGTSPRRSSVTSGVPAARRAVHHPRAGAADPLPAGSSSLPASTAPGSCISIGRRTSGDSSPVRGAPRISRAAASTRRWRSATCPTTARPARSAACTIRPRLQKRRSSSAASRGAIHDVLVDLRRGSPTYRTWVGARSHG